MNLFKAIVLGVLIVLVAISCNTSSKGKSKKILPEELQELLKNSDAQLVDVRTPEEFKNEHILTAQNINVLSPSFNDDIKSLDKNKPVVVYCKSGGRSTKCAKKLLKLGFAQIYDLQGGITSWKQRHLK